MALAIVTGATSGLGLAYAKLLAFGGWDLLLTGRRKSLLLEIKRDLERDCGVHVDVFNVDFTKAPEFEKFGEYVSALDKVEMLINNAGFGCRKGFVEGSFVEHQQMMQVSITATTKLIHTVIPKMIKQHKGYIINVSSLSAFLPAPLNYFYCSSKAFLVSFTQCLHIDLHAKGIETQVLCPGFIHTGFHKRMGIDNNESGLTKRMFWMDAEKVAKLSLKALGKPKVVYIPGFTNRMIYQLHQWMPKPFYYWLIKKGSLIVENIPESKAGLNMQEEVVVI